METNKYWVSKGDLGFYVLEDAWDKIGGNYYNSVAFYENEEEAEKCAKEMNKTEMEKRSQIVKAMIQNGF